MSLSSRERNAADDAFVAVATAIFARPLDLARWVHIDPAPPCWRQVAVSIACSRCNAHVDNPATLSVRNASGSCHDIRAFPSPKMARSQFSPQVVGSIHPWGSPGQQGCRRFNGKRRSGLECPFHRGGRGSPQHVGNFPGDPLQGPTWSGGFISYFSICTEVYEVVWTRPH